MGRFGRALRWGTSRAAVLTENRTNESAKRGESAERCGSAERGEPPACPALREAARTFAYLGLVGFGGPAGQIGIMHRVLVNEKRWIGDERFLHALNYCMLLPGPEATQLVTYVGWLMFGLRGGLLAGVLFVLPGFVALLALSVVYTTFGDISWVQGVLLGLKAAVVALVAEAVVRIGKRVVRSGALAMVAVGAFAAICVLGTPFPWIVACAAAAGAIGSAVSPGMFRGGSERGMAGGVRAEETVLGNRVPEHARASAPRAVVMAVVWGVIWLAPVGGIVWGLGMESIFSQIAVLFSKAAVVTFGGAYAVLAYIAQRAVEVEHWITAQDMVAGLGLAETTPGPLIMVLQFVGYVGAHRNPEGLEPWVAGVLASVLTAWVTFVPCFAWIFVGGPYMEALRSRRVVQGALSAVSAAVVGVIANLGVWMAVHTLFARSGERRWGVVRVPWPEWSSINWGAATIAAAAGVLLVGLKWGVLRTLAACTLLGAAWVVWRSRGGG